MSADEQKKDDLAPGTWVTESSGFASVPPRATSDLGAVCEEQKEDASREDDESKSEEKP